MALLVDILYSAVLTAFLTFGFFLTLKYARIFLMSFGEFVILGGYISSFLAAGVFGWLSALGLAALAGAVGGAMTYGLLRSMFQRGRTIDSLLVTWGSALVLMEVYRFCFGSAGRFAPSFFNGISLIDGVPFPVSRTMNIVTIAVAACLIGVAIRLLDRRRQLTALAFGHRVAGEFGVPVPAMLCSVMVLSCASACVAGVLVGQEAAITPYGGIQYTMLAALAALVAGPRLWQGIAIAAALAGIRTLLGFELGLTPAWLIVLALVVIGASLQRNSVVIYES